MLANRVQEETATATAGDLILTGAVTNHQTFNTAFGTDQYFYYWIVDDTNNVWECGVGHLTTSTNLVRDKVLDNSSGTTTALTLSSGTKSVFCAAPERSQAAGATTIYSSANVTVLKSAHADAIGNAPVGAANRIHYTPFKLETGVEVTSLNIYVTTADATNTDVLLGVYDWDTTNGDPGFLLTENNLVVSAATTGLKTGTLTTATYLGPGWYWVAVACEGTPTIWGSTYNDTSGGPQGTTTSIGRSIPGMREAYTGNWTTPALPSSGGGTYTNESYTNVPTLMLDY